MIGDWPADNDEIYRDTRVLSLRCVAALNEIMMTERPQTVISALAMAIGFLASQRLTAADAVRVGDIVGILINDTIVEHST